MNIDEYLKSRENEKMTASDILSKFDKVLIADSGDNYYYSLGELIDNYSMSTKKHL